MDINECAIVCFRFGPLRQHWCMRFESKNAQIKRFVKLSFRNVPLTVSIHHQQWMCYRLLTQPNQSVSNFFYSGDEIVSGKNLDIKILRSTLIHVHVFGILYETCRLNGEC